MHFDKYAICLFVIIYLAATVKSYKFLGILPTAYKSHFIFGSALMKGLAEKGHEVYVIAPFRLEHPLKNYYHVDFSLKNSLLEDRRNDHLKYHEFLVAHEVFNSTNVQKLMNGDHKFDAVICESTYSDALFGFSDHFKAPLITLSPLGRSYWNTDMRDSHLPPPSIGTIFSNHMNDKEREFSFIRYILNKFELHLRGVLGRAPTTAVYKICTYLLHLIRDLLTVRKNAAAVLLNTHIAISPPIPYMPNEIPLGGLHLNRQRQPLPKDLEKFIGEAKHGVIYFSVGADSESSTYVDANTKEIFNAFRTLKQRVLWKHPQAQLKGRYANIVISPWFPQQDILAHGNVKLLITQGGLLSIIEGFYYGKPMLGIPVHSDQFENMSKANHAGSSVSLSGKNLTGTEIVEAAKYVIATKSYMDKAKEMALRCRDQPVWPLDLATYWVEHVVRHKGANYLRCAGLDLNIIQSHNIDAGLFLVFLLLPVTCIVCFILKSLR